MIKNKKKVRTKVSDESGELTKIARNNKIPMSMKIIASGLSMVALSLMVCILYQAGQKSVVGVKNDKIERVETVSNEKDALFDNVNTKLINTSTSNDIDDSDNLRDEEVSSAEVNSNEVSENVDNNVANISPEDIVAEDVNSDFFKEETKKIELELDDISSEYDALEGINDTLRSWFPFP